MLVPCRQRQQRFSIWDHMWKSWKKSHSEYCGKISTCIANQLLQKNHVLSSKSRKYICVQRKILFYVRNIIVSPYFSGHGLFKRISNLALYFQFQYFSDLGTSYIGTFRDMPHGTYKARYITSKGTFCSCAALCCSSLAEQNPLFESRFCDGF